MPRFTLRDVFLATTLIAIGAAGGVAAWHGALGTHSPWLGFVSGVVAGIGVGIPLHRKMLCAVLGTVVACMLVGIALARI